MCPQYKFQINMVICALMIDKSQNLMQKKEKEN